MLPVSFSRSGGKAFTLVELTVSMALIVAIMLMLLSTVDNTQRLWVRTSAKATQFQSARAAFESMTRRLSQATLNTYWRAYDGDTRNAKAEFQFRRHSELQFLSGGASRILTSPSVPGLNSPPNLSYPGHAVFFQSPLGYTEYVRTGDVREFRNLDNLLTGCGYFLEYGEDPSVPDFIRAAGVPPRKRFRLVELTVPSERMSIHQRFNDTVGNIEPQVLDAAKKDYVGLVDAAGASIQSWMRPFWMEEALRRESSEGGVSHFKYGRTLAENIAALVILPKQARKDRPSPDSLGSLAPEYQYDSWRVLRKDATTGLANAARDNLLPPIVQVLFVAVDEASAARVANRGEPPAWTDGLFQRVNMRQDYLTDLASLESRLRDDPAHVNYRIFSADVVIRGSKWSQTP